jgi:hypothetical protein
MWSSLEGPISDELCRQLPKNAAFQEPLEDVALNLAELEPLSSLITFKGFSSAFRIYFIGGRFEDLGFKQDFATIAIAQTSSK